MIPRLVQETIEQSLQEFSAVMVIGPRAAGKSTCCQAALPNDSHRFQMDLPLDRAKAEVDPEAFFAPGSSPLLLDEVQAWPESFKWVKNFIDQDRSIKGRYLLTGSQQFQLLKEASDSLVGRMALVTLFPLSWAELAAIGALPMIPTLADTLALALRGGYPELWAFPSLSRNRWMEAYLNLYLERDVGLLHGIQQMGRFRTFLGVLAPRAAQVLNVASIARECGVPESTIRDWLSILERSMLIRLLQPYSANFSKRWVKAPKLIFCDTGLLCYLLGIDTVATLERSPMWGHIFENLVIMEAIKLRSFEESRCHMFYLRIDESNEIDLLIQRGTQLIGYEIKSRATVTPKDASSLERLSQVVPLTDRVVLSLHPDSTSLTSKSRCMPWSQGTAALDQPT